MTHSNFQWICEPGPSCSNPIWVDPGLGIDLVSHFLSLKGKCSLKKKHTKNVDTNLSAKFQSLQNGGHLDAPENMRECSLSATHFLLLFRFFKYLKFRKLLN